MNAYALCGEELNKSHGLHFRNYNHKCSLLWVIFCLLCGRVGLSNLTLNYMTILLLVQLISYCEKQILKSTGLEKKHNESIHKRINLRWFANSAYELLANAQFSLCVQPSSHALLKRLKESPGAFDNDALVVFDVVFEAFCLPPAVAPQTLQSSPNLPDHGHYRLPRRFWHYYSHQRLPRYEKLSLDFSHWLPNEAVRGLSVKLLECCCLALPWAIISLACYIIRLYKAVIIPEKCFSLCNDQFVISLATFRSQRFFQSKGLLCNCWTVKEISTWNRESVSDSGPG